MLKIVFENENFVFCDKPGLILSVPDRLGLGSDKKCLGYELQKQKKIQIFPVHRLDFEVSGLIMFAKNEESHRQSQEWFEKRLIKKKYIAITKEQSFEHQLVWPDKAKASFDFLKITPIEKQEFKWQSQILRGKRRSFESAEGEIAITDARFVRVKNKYLYWELYPLTGKPHQLRFEMSKRGFPIVLDVLYGGAESNLTDLGWTEKGICLRSMEIDFSAIKERFDLPALVKVDV